jgi:hypothetical protein
MSYAPAKSYPGEGTVRYVSGLATLPGMMKGSAGDVAGLVAGALLIVFLFWLF